MKKIELTQLQKDVLLYIGKSDFGKNFYWTGGTLLSYFYLSHRFSVDLDFFSEDLFRDIDYAIFINELRKEIKADKITSSIQQNRRLYFIEKGKDNVKLEFVFFPFPKTAKRLEVKEFFVKADSLLDIMINKVHSAYERNEVKDVYDLYWYLKDKPKYGLKELINFVEKRFGVAIEPTLLLEKINKLCDDFEKLMPLLINSEKDIAKKVRSFFQNEFNKTLKIK
ncbi:MAG: nucleotidyl transferase AbiEii/AbiGii toxin family protein [bacterium]|nr:nucleotidyl transferase AbiEii/AbiGii toxin family protein [bacterium]